MPYEPTVCCCKCHEQNESPLYHYRKTEDMALWYKHMEYIANSGNVGYPTGITTLSPTIFISGLNGDCPPSDAIATIKHNVDISSISQVNTQK
jgi:hypothetical protein